MTSFRASNMFSFVVLVTLVLLGVIGGMVLLMQLQPGFMGMAHGTEPHHRVHDLTFAFLLGPAAVGLLAQLRTPSRNIAGQLMALVPWLALLLAFVSARTWLVFAPAPILGALTLLAAILHPARREFIRSARVARVHPVMLALVIVAAAPLLAFASSNIGLQRTLTNDHAALGHYGFMAAFSFTVIGIGLLTSARPPGWRLTAWVAGLLPALLGLASLLYPNNDSSLGTAWAVAAIAWGSVSVAAAELIRNSTGEPDHEGDAAPAGVLAGNMPRSMKALGIVVLILGVLFSILHITGGAPGRHGP